MRMMVVAAAAAALVGCATASKISNVQLGMTRAEVEQVMGKPVSTSQQGGTTYMSYALSETDDEALAGITRPYFVRLIDGKVESFGRTGDFNSTQTPTARQQIETVGAGATDNYTKLLQLKDLHDKKIISDAEYEEQRKKLLNGIQ